MRESWDLRPRIKMSIITCISALRFYGYIKYIDKKNINRLKIDQNL